MQAERVKAEAEARKQLEQPHLQLRAKPSGPPPPPPVPPPLWRLQAPPPLPQQDKPAAPKVKAPPAAPVQVLPPAQAVPPGARVQPPPDKPPQDTAKSSMSSVSSHELTQAVRPPGLEGAGAGASAEAHRPAGAPMSSNQLHELHELREFQGAGAGPTGPLSMGSFINHTNASAARLATNQRTIMQSFGGELQLRHWRSLDNMMTFFEDHGIMSQKELVFRECRTVLQCAAL